MRREGTPYVVQVYEEEGNALVQVYEEEGNTLVQEYEEEGNTLVQEYEEGVRTHLRHTRFSIELRMLAMCPCVCTFTPKQAEFLLDLAIHAVFPYVTVC